MVKWTNVAFCATIKCVRNKHYLNLKWHFWGKRTNTVLLLQNEELNSLEIATFLGLVWPWINYKKWIQDSKAPISLSENFLPSTYAKITFFSPFPVCFHFIWHTWVTYFFLDFCPFLSFHLNISKKTLMFTCLFHCICILMQVCMLKIWLWVSYSFLSVLSSPLSSLFLIFSSDIFFFLLVL